MLLNMFHVWKLVLPTDGTPLHLSLSILNQGWAKRRMGPTNPSWDGRQLLRVSQF